MAKKKKLFTTGNIILGVIVLALIASLFYDFLGEVSTGNDGPRICPEPIEGLVISNFGYMHDGKPFDGLRKEPYVPPENATEEYWVQGTLRNRGKNTIVVSQLALTEQHLGTFDMLDIEDIVIEPNSIKNFKINLDRGDYHKIDLYTDDVCEGTVIWHDEVGHETGEPMDMGAEDTI